MKKIVILFLAICMMCSSALAQVEVTGSKVNLRSGPGLDYDVVGVANKGAILPQRNDIVTDDRGVDWYWVEFAGQGCWISSTYARIVEDDDEPHPAGGSVSYEDLAGSYWRAYLYEANGDGYSYTEELPSENWSFELFLNEDDTLLLHDWNPATNEYLIPADKYTHWSFNGEVLYIHPAVEDNDLGGGYASFDKNGNMQLCLNEYGAGKICLVREDRELMGNECIPADLTGEWKTVYMTYYGEELGEADMAEWEFHENLLIDMAYDDEGRLCMQADFIQSYPVDTAWTQFQVLTEQWPISVWHDALANFETLYQDWSANLYDPYDVNGDYGWYLTMIDRDNIMLVCVDNFSGDEPVIDVRRLRRMTEDERRIPFEMNESYDESSVINRLADTRWVAAREERTDYETGEVSVIQLPNEYGGYELLLFADGTAQWQALNSYNGGLTCDPDGYWQMRNGQIIFSTYRDLAQNEEWDIVIFDEAENAIVWNAHESRRVILEPAAMTEKWQTPSVQSLLDTWSFVYGSADGWDYTAEEEGDKTMLRFYMNNFGELCMDYRSNRDLVTSAKALPAVQVMESDGLISGWAPWHVEVALHENMETRIFMPDENTLQMENLYLLDGSPAVSSRIFKRASDIE